MYSVFAPTAHVSNVNIHTILMRLPSKALRRARNELITRNVHRFSGRRGQGGHPSNVMLAWPWRGQDGTQTKAMKGDGWGELKVGLTMVDDMAIIASGALVGEWLFFCLRVAILFGNTR